MNILIVDDNRLTNQFLCAYFRARGHACSSIADKPKRTLAWLDLNACDAVIMEISLPGIDGISLLQEIRKSEKYPKDKLAVVIFTRYGYDEDLVRKAKLAGANGYVSKGLGPQEVYEALMKVKEILQAKNDPDHFVTNEKITLIPKRMSA